MPNGAGDARPQAVRTLRGAALDPATVLAAKGDTRVSVVIPARDEETTVGAVVAGVRRAWVEQVPLVDELVVMDSDSTDATARVAREAGATAYATRDVRPDLGPGRGKGEALWKALFVTTGDVLVFLDADLIEWDPHFVVGLLAPFVLEDGVDLVKAVYHRPLLDEHGREAETGGRVTELVARPLLALHHPELAPLVQPLAGEWAVRRSVFERLSVPCGYGVEIAALIDVARARGPGAVAQVELGRRAHRHHRHDALGQMAVQVLGAVEARCGTRGPQTVRDVVALRQFDHDAGGFHARVSEVDVRERPPAVTVPAGPGWASGTGASGRMRA